MKITLADWHGAKRIEGTVCLALDIAADTLVTYWGERPAELAHVLALPSRALDPGTLAEWCAERTGLIDAIATAADDVIAADLRTQLAIALSAAMHAGVVRRLLPVAIALSRVPGDVKRTPEEHAAEILRVEGYEVSPAAIQREREKVRDAAEEVLTVRLSR